MLVYTELQDRLALSESRCRELESVSGGPGGSVGAGGGGSTAADKAAARRIQDLEQVSSNYAPSMACVHFACWYV